LLNAIPVLIFQLIASLGMIIEAILLAIPDIIIGFISALPQLIMAFMTMMPKIIIGIITGLIVAIPQIISALVFGIIAEIPRIVLELIKGIILGLINGIKDFVNVLGKIFKEALGFLGDLFGKDKNGDGFLKRTGKKIGKGAKAAWDGLTGMFSYSGVDYVPANMRMTVHKGEAIVPASRNPAAGGTPDGIPNPAQAGSGRGGGGGGQPIEVIVTAEGRVLDAVQTTAMSRGHAPGMTRELRRRSGVDIGFNRGNFQYWTKK